MGGLLQRSSRKQHKMMITPNFYTSPYFVNEPDNWHLTDDAPEDVRKEFEDHPDCVQDDGLIRAMKSYYRAFGDTFPSYPNPPENAVEIIRDCLQKKKDAYELGYLSLDDNIIY